MFAGHPNASPLAAQKSAEARRCLSAGNLLVEAALGHIGAGMGAAVSIQRRLWLGAVPGQVDQDTANLLAGNAISLGSLFGSEGLSGLLSEAAQDSPPLGKKKRRRPRGGEEAQEAKQRLIRSADHF